MKFGLIILDRDGVINDAPKGKQRYIMKLEDLTIMEEVTSKIAQLQEFFDVAVATNQQCLGKGILSEVELKRLHDAIDENIVSKGGIPLVYFVCGHLEEESCRCRKPKTGLLLDAMSHFSYYDKNRIYFIGDSVTDEKAGNLANIGFFLTKHVRTTLQILDNLRDIARQASTN